MKVELLDHQEGDRKQARGAGGGGKEKDQKGGGRSTEQGFTISEVADNAGLPSLELHGVGGTRSLQKEMKVRRMGRPMWEGRSPQPGGAALREERR
eukprot:750064-Hanusia_phi.AAC.2